jgi:hypothetical protein
VPPPTKVANPARNPHATRPARIKYLGRQSRLLFERSPPYS